jgi:hypothetical protein
VWRFDADADDAKVKVFTKDDKTLILELAGSGIDQFKLRGVIRGLNFEEFRRLTWEDGDTPAELLQLISSDTTTFKANELEFDDSSSVKTVFKTHIRHLKQLDLSPDCNCCSTGINELRRDTIKAIGTNEHTSQFDSFVETKNRLCSLNCVKNFVDEVVIRHEEETIYTELGSGCIMGFGDGEDLAWCIPVPDEDKILNGVTELCLTISGVPLPYREASLRFFVNGDNAVVNWIISPNAIIQSQVSLEDFDVDDDDFPQDFMEAVFTGDADFEVNAVFVKLEAIKGTLEALGIDYHDSFGCPCCREKYSGVNNATDEEANN